MVSSLLLLFLSLRTCAAAGPILQYGYKDLVKAAEAGAHTAAQMKESFLRDDCEGILDICCRYSSHGAGMLVATTKQKPLSSLDTNERPTSRLRQAMKIPGALVSLAADAWCAPAASSSAPMASQPDLSCAATKETWAGLDQLQHVFSFGDSYTSTDFEWWTEPYPGCDPSHPMGNPAYPGFTSANGPNWIDYLTVKYNKTAFATYNIAVGGATAGPVGRDVPSVKSLRGQVHDSFMPAYHEGQAPGAPAWTSDRSLFTFWLGINDIGGSFWRGPAGPGGTKAINRAIMAEYARLLADLYAAGASNFAFVNVPPIDRSPLTAGAGPGAQLLEKADVEDFNALLADMAQKASTWDGANVWLYDAHADFGKVLDDPASFPQTKGYRNVTDFCEAYQL